MLDKFYYEVREAIRQCREELLGKQERFGPPPEIPPPPEPALPSSSLPRIDSAPSKYRKFSIPKERLGPEQDGWFMFWGESICQIGDGHYLVESLSFPGEHHSVDSRDGSCSCKGFECVKHCRHLSSIQGYELARHSTQDQVGEGENAEPGGGSPTGHEEAEGRDRDNPR